MQYNSLNISMKPQDIVVLLQICCSKSDWIHVDLAKKLFMSQSEISQSISRSKFSGLLDSRGKKVRTQALLDFLKCGIAYVFPQRPGPIVRGVPTAHSAKPLNEVIASEESFVWPDAKGSTRGQAIEPLYTSVTKAIQNNPDLYALLALVDAMRVGRNREKEEAFKRLTERIDECKIE